MKKDKMDSFKKIFNSVKNKIRFKNMKKPVINKTVIKEFLINIKNDIFNNRSSIKTKIFIRILALILAVVVILGGLSTYQGYKLTINTLEQTMVNLAAVSSDSISNKIETYKTIAKDIGLNPVISDLSVNKSVRAKVLEQLVEAYGLVDAYNVTVMGSGESPVTKELYIISDTDYFNAAMEGNVFVAEPTYNKKLEKFTITVSAPIWKNGIYNSSVSGVAVIVLDGQVLSDIASAVHIGKNGYGFILNKEGLTIGHPDYEKVISGENTLNSSDNKTYESMSKIQKRLLNGEINFGKYELNNKNNFIAYSPIDSSNGWGFFISAPQAEYLSSTNLSIVITLIVSIMSLVLAYIVGRNIANQIADPIIISANRLKMLSDGDLHTKLEETNSKDEVGILIKSLGRTIKGLNIIINDISSHLGAMAEGDFSKNIDMKYNGDFNAIAISMKKINNYLNTIVKQVNESAEQVASGSEQLAVGAQALSQGATEQASSVDELSFTLSDVSSQVSKNASSARLANEASIESSNQVIAGNKFVNEMNQAMININDTSREIAKIIKVIDEIAFQTNILALNSAVEAARAGAAGRGFAVVADEVRNLASKSAEAAKNTTTLIENSIKAVENGVKVAKQTKLALDQAVEKSNIVSSMIDEISNASSQQAVAVTQVLAGLEQISSIVQTNSATAEESAAASEELNGQAQVLKELVEDIKLNDSLSNVFVKTN